jgi:hypothetical protein
MPRAPLPVPTNTGISTYGTASSVMKRKRVALAAARGGKIRSEL